MFLKEPHMFNIISIYDKQKTIKKMILKIYLFYVIALHM